MIIAINKENEKRSFKNIREAARKLGLQEQKVREAFKFGDSLFGWIFDESLAFIVAWNEKTGEILEFSSEKEAADALNVAPFTINSHLYQSLYPLKGVHLFKKEDVFDGDFKKALRKRKKDFFDNNKKRAVKVLFANGKEEIFPSVSKAAKSLHATWGKVSKASSSESFITIINKKKKVVKVLFADGRVFLFPSVLEAAKSLNFSWAKVSRHSAPNKFIIMINKKCE